MSEKKRLRIQILLLVVTVITTTIAGAEWMYGKLLILGNMTIEELFSGLQYSIPFLLILTCHEFGHYLTARYYKIDVTLPYYIPMWLFGILPTIGTMGAFIRIKAVIESRKEYFDVGIAGPLAGFFVALGFIWFGFTHLPEPEYIFQIHPEYEEYGLDYPNHVYEDEEGISITFGGNILFWFFENYVVEDTSKIPHPNEMIHYPLLLAGYLALFFTALNLLPIGQLDGGHVVFGIFGERHSRRISEVLFTLFVFYAGLGVIDPSMLENVSTEATFNFILILAGYLYFLYLCFYSMIEVKRDRLMMAAIVLTAQFAVSFIFDLEGNGWVVFALFIGRFLGIYHPPVIDNRPLDSQRIWLAIIALIVFTVSFSPQLLVVE